MSTEDDKALVREFLEVYYGAGDTDAFDEYLAPDVVFAGVGGQIEGLEGVKEAAARVHSMLYTAAPDIEMKVEEMVAEDGSVAVHLTEEGTFSGPYQSGPLSVDPTGERFRVTALELFHLNEGKITVRWAARDRLGFLQQMGIPVQIG